MEKEEAEAYEAFKKEELNLSDAEKELKEVVSSMLFEVFLPAIKQAFHAGYKAGKRAGW